MSMQYQLPSLIGAETPAASNAFMDRFESARSAGSVTNYEYKNVKPKKTIKRDN